ncbi:MAG: hypothetical protein LBQ54_08070 [Planctomycetaceae bacterium]|nr:hypothetical protein [Planctomycetaceae bacterium]
MFGLRFGIFRPNLRRIRPDRDRRISELILFSLLFIVGAVFFLIHLFTWIIPDWEDGTRYIKGTCIVQEKRLGSKVIDGEEFFRPEFLIKYRANEEDFLLWTYQRANLEPETGFDFDKISAEEILKNFEIGSEPRCWIDQTRPSQAVLYRPANFWGWFFLAIPVFLIVSSGMGFYIALRRHAVSAERMVRVRSTTFPGFAPPKKGSLYPTIPDPADINDSPGTHLAYRLQMTQISFVKIITTLILCLFWNIVSWTVFLITVFSKSLIEQTGIPGIAGGVSLCLVGMILLVWVVHQFLVAFGVGPTILEVSDHPIYSGRKYRLMLFQFGAFRVKNFRVDLVCEEIVRFRQGTDTMTMQKEVICKTLYEKQDFETQSETPLQEELILHLPLGSMHSFQAEHSEILWKFIVRAEFAGWPKLERVFPIIVRPATLFRFQNDWDDE